MAADVFIIMETSIDLQSLLQGPVDQVVGRLNSLLGQLDMLQAGNGRIFEQLRYKVVKRKNDKDHTRYMNLFNLKGPDRNTFDLVTTHESHWQAYPSDFWTRPDSGSMQFSGPRCHLSSQAQLVGHYLQAKCDGA